MMCGRKEGRKGGRKEGRKEGRRERGRITWGKEVDGWVCNIED